MSHTSSRLVDSDVDKEKSVPRMTGIEDPLHKLLRLESRLRLKEVLFKLIEKVAGLPLTRANQVTPVIVGVRS